ncbi:MAG TPA: hypothetical protein PK478_00815 [Nitrospira sp.]|nr:hypothetical protein [Nitrospira sp.]
MTDTPVPAALTCITDQAEAKARYALVDATIAQLTLSTFPQPVLTEVGTFEDPEWVLVCPWCKTHMSQEDGIIEVDAAIRWNRGTYYPDDRGVAIHQGDGNYDTMVYLAACCETPIDLPDGWETSW